MQDNQDYSGDVDAAALAAGEPVPAAPEEVSLRVPVNMIIDQAHQHWAAMLAGQVQRNAELSAALTVTQEELVEVKGKLAALQQVVNSPA